MTWNARSVRNKRLELQQFLIVNYVDICLVSETWLSVCDRFFIPGYLVYRNDRRSGRGGGISSQSPQPT